MIEQKLEISLPDGVAEAFFYKPDSVGDFPGVIFLTDIWGIRPANQGMAKRLAERGFAVLVPNVFFRHGRLPLVPPGFQFKAGEPRSMRIMAELFQALTAKQMSADGPAYLDNLFKQKGVAGEKAGVVGYCFTGAMALRMAAASPERIAAAASFHGGRLVQEGDPDSPHLLLPKIKARLYFGHAVEDQSMTAEQIAILEAALRDWRGAFQSKIYEGARHGWTVPGGPAYNELQAERAFEKLVELFDATLE
jgi:carboxymethylenebutenolidase